MIERGTPREVGQKPHGDGGLNSHARGQVTEGLNNPHVNHKELRNLPPNQAAKDALPATQIHDGGTNKSGGPGKDAPPPTANPAKPEDQPAKNPEQSKGEKDTKMAALTLITVNSAGNDNHPPEGNPPGGTHRPSYTTRPPIRIVPSGGRPANDN